MALLYKRELTEALGREEGQRRTGGRQNLLGIVRVKTESNYDGSTPAKAS